MAVRMMSVLGSSSTIFNAARSRSSSQFPYRSSGFLPIPATICWRSSSRVTRKLSFSSSLSFSLVCGANSASSMP